MAQHWFSFPFPFVSTTTVGLTFLNWITRSTSAKFCRSIRRRMLTMMDWKEVCFVIRYVDAEQRSQRTEDLLLRYSFVFALRCVTQLQSNVTHSSNMNNRFVWSRHVSVKYPLPATFWVKGSNIYITCLYIVYILCGLIMLYLWCECCCVACELRNYRLARSRVSKFHSLILFRFFDGRIQKRRERERETMKGRGPFHFFRPFNRRPYSRRPSLITPAHMVVKTFVVSLSPALLREYMHGGREDEEELVVISDSGGVTVLLTSVR